MFTQGSRYFKIQTALYTDNNGRQINYKRRRILPKGEEMPVMGETVVKQSERLDLIAHRVLGDAEHFWRICDINNAIEPGELTLVPGRVLYVPIPTPE